MSSSPATIPVGYKQTIIGLFPEEWNLTSISDITTKVGSGVTPRGGSQRYKDSGRAFVRSQNVGWGRLILQDLVFIDEETHQEFPSTELIEQDLLLNITGASIGRVSMIDNRISGGNVNQHVCIIRTITSCSDAAYIKYILLSPIGQNQIDSFQAGGNREGLNFPQIRSILLPLPPTKAEQEIIANILSDADDLIESLEQLIAKKRYIKQGTMQELLTGKTRLPGFSGEWKSEKLKNIGMTFGGLTGKSKDDFGHGIARYITFMNIMTNVVIDCNALESVSVTKGETQNAVSLGDLFFNGSSETPEEVGMCSYLDEELHDVYLNSFCFGFRPNRNSKNDSQYLAYFFRSQEGRKLMASLAQGSTRYNISKTALLSVDFLIPELSEQQAIAEVLSDMDAEITALEQRLEKTKAIKQGMMQQLLTGRIRLVEPSTPVEASA